jgi:hypothetical protein
LDVKLPAVADFSAVVDRPLLPDVEGSTARSGSGSSCHLLSLVARPPSGRSQSTTHRAGHLVVVPGSPHACHVANSLYFPMCAGRQFVRYASATLDQTARLRHGTSRRCFCQAASPGADAQTACDVEGECHATDSLADDRGTRSAAGGLCGREHHPDGGGSTGIGPYRHASRWAPDRQSAQCDTGRPIG